ncbi:MAG: DUF4411 family protein [Sulfuricella sp.]|nr:DUF4411 family protein [Sulfuricella sp.]
MIYVFDTGSLSKLKHFYPNVFKSVWIGLDSLVDDGSLLSTREVWKEMQNGEPHKHTNEWLKARQHIFTVPSAEELKFVAQIFLVPHFRSLIGEAQRLKGTPVADPFVIAAAKVRNGTVVTEERIKPGAAKIPNVCAHFKVPCIDLETFMQGQNWEF